MSVTNVSMCSPGESSCVTMSPSDRPRAVVTEQVRVRRRLAAPRDEVILAHHRQHPPVHEFHRLERVDEVIPGRSQCPP
jgi:hypothetical protein